MGTVHKRVCEKYPAFADMLARNFPGAVQYEEALVGATSVLGRHSFGESNSIALVSQCRDELTKPLVEAADRLWGQSFSISSLAGMVLCGKTGFGAAMHHAPNQTSNEQYVVIAGPHIGINADGEVGNVRRPGRGGFSGACGSLMAFRGELTRCQVCVTNSRDDFEQTLVKQRLMEELRYGAVPDLVDLTKAADRAIQKDVARTFESALRGSKSDSRHALFTGVLIHGPEGSNFFFPTTLQKSFYTGATGTTETTDLTTELGTALANRAFKSDFQRYCKSKANDIARDVVFRSVSELRSSLLNVNDINTGDYDMRTAVHIAAEIEDREKVQLLLSLGGDLSICDSAGNNVIQGTIRSGKYDMARWLNTEYSTHAAREFVESRIAAAVTAGDTNQVECLLACCEAKVAATWRGFDDVTLLHLAARSAQADKMTQILLGAGADPEAVDAFGRKASDCAAGAATGEGSPKRRRVD